MQELKVIGVENGALLAASDEGARFRIAIDEVMQSRLRRAQPEQQRTAPRISPREIQTLIRSGLSAEETASVTGTDVEYVERFEGPVLAEREHIVTSALGVPVHPGADVDPAEESVSFGAAIRERLHRLGSTGERWASWKDTDQGWIVKLEFTADEIDHDARWTFEPRKRSLHPINSEAITLSQQGELKGGLIPRLRAVDAESNADQTRFDSGAFAFAPDVDTPAPSSEGGSASEPIPYSRTMTAVSSPAVAKAAIKRAEEPTRNVSETADLLEALRRRRGERESATFEEAAGRAPAADLVDLAEELHEPEPATPASLDAHSPDTRKDRAEARSLWGSPSVSGGDGGEPHAASATSARGRKGRVSMPSWDEIVFGARTDDDPA
jgi:hypothetical protein